jgi:phosphonate transport system permease protein
MITADLKKQPHTKRYLTAFFIIFTLWASAYQTDATLGKLLVGAPEMGKLLIEMIPPDWSYIDVVWGPMLQTVQMAIVGSTVGALAAIPLSLLAARNVSCTPWLYLPARFILNLIRTIPDLLYAALFFAVFGLGPLPGVLALSFFSFGIISKLTYESIEAIDSGPLEAMTAVGANKLQWIHFGVIPQVLAPYVSYYLYTFEINVRAAAILGLVGAGGIGLYLDRALNQFRYDRASLIILLTLAIVLLIDYASSRIRRRLL